MATVLSKKPVVREIRDWRKQGMFGLGHGGRCRPLVVSLEPGNFFSFREKGFRRTYDVDIESVFNLAVRRTLQKAKREVKKCC